MSTNSLLYFLYCLLASLLSLILLLDKVDLLFTCTCLLVTIPKAGLHYSEVKCSEALHVREAKCRKFAEGTFAQSFHI